MKKTLLALAAAALALSANATTVYFDNEGTGWEKVYGYSWEPEFLEELSTVVIDGHTLYVADLSNAQIIFRGNDSKWADDLQTSNLDVKEGAVYGKNNVKSFAGSVDPQANIVDGKYVAVTPDEFPAMFLVGKISGWGASSDYKMSTTDGKTYTLTVENMPAGDTDEGAFKFYGGAWGTRELTIDNQALTAGTYTLSGGAANMGMAEAGKVTFTLVQENDFESATLTIATGDDPNPPTPGDDYTGWYLNVRGDYNDWVAQGVEFSKEGTAVAKNQKIGDGYFEIRIWNKTADVDYSNGETVETDKDYVLPLTNATGMKVAGATPESTYDVYFNAKTNTMKLVEVESIPDVITYGLSGNIFGEADWSTQDMTQDGDVWSWSGSVYPGDFGIKRMNNGTQNAWFNSADENSTVSGNGEFQAKTYGTNWTIDFKGKCSISFNTSTEMLIVSGTVGVSEMVTESGEAVYFNLQGARVANAEKGVFIRVVNGKAEKVIR